ncbi:Phosphatidylinositol N-acetylglucosaminyltransferase subunit P [Platanthera guangdongensis]|uniref:Phosphatidylinositol N-acetylglucosaminyltransferase subunit P n=1 Tax=Platanthera guangdongensis TaxID=2320717 RepID=A0ABR2LUG3_9ASPA
MLKSAPRSTSKIAFATTWSSGLSERDGFAPSSPTSLVVSSPRRTLSLLRERRVFTSDPEGKKSLEAETTVTTTTGFVVEHGPKTSEVYGFVGIITIVIATVCDPQQMQPGFRSVSTHQINYCVKKESQKTCS